MPVATSPTTTFCSLAAATSTLQTDSASCSHWSSGSPGLGSREVCTCSPLAPTAYQSGLCPRSSLERFYLCQQGLQGIWGAGTFHSSGGFAVVGHAGSTGRLETTYLAPQGAHHQGLDAGMDDMVQARSLTAEGLPSWLQQAHDHGHRPSSLSGNTTAVGAVSGSLCRGLQNVAGIGGKVAWSLWATTAIATKHGLCLHRA